MNVLNESTNTSLFATLTPNPFVFSFSFRWVRLSESCIENTRAVFITIGKAVVSLPYKSSASFQSDWIADSLLSERPRVL